MRKHTRYPEWFYALNLGWYERMMFMRILPPVDRCPFLNDTP